MTYVDGFVIAVPEKNLDAYRKMAEIGKTVWMEHGALDYKECVGDDLGDHGFGGMTFTERMNLTKDEIVIFAYIVYKSREHRDEVNAKVMTDPRLSEGCGPDNAPFEMKRMTYGGFKTLVEV